MAEKVTIMDVARAAGVSRQTVSNTLNSPEVVREETRRHVLDVIERLGYRANQAARQMRTGRSRLIAIRIDPGGDGISGSVLDTFLHGLTESAARAGYRVLLYTAADDRSEIAAFEDLLGSYEPDAFVLTATHHDDLRTSWLLERGLPFVAFGRPWSDLPGARHPWVDVDGAAGTEAATRRLLAAGHRRIGFIGWPPGSGVGDDRRAGWARTMAQHGPAPDGRGRASADATAPDGRSTASADAMALEGLSRAVEDGVESGERAARDLLAADPGVTALVCASDSLALGALNTPGRRVAVIGFDDTPAARAAGLTSVRQPLAEAAAACVELLTRTLGHAAAPAEHVLLEPSLTVRRSA
ncbi:LacI family DNA-binding transcriptional regulator [Nonomuraea turcica]|uniref:LacI family DNA-binding transcriptional regulator n=1 Tax=Nonomuraea sp. G32 TaxID=3067274 RepID=UPI00273C98B7|nr:substrate-binding domain-containing protein [Nonomuraea sp. G32]MDP4506821.1 substrate-binding domain-containing protein [Nonomuraea sp. G32]